MKHKKRKIKDQNLEKVIATFFGVGGVLFCWAGIGFWGDMGKDTERRAELQGAISLTSAQARQSAYLEGTISPETPIIHNLLVCYIKERYIHRRRSDWYEESRDTPPLRVQATDSMQTIGNSDYELVKTPVTMDDDPSGDKEIRSRGFTVGSPIIALGTRESNGSITANTLYPGDREQYLTYLADKTKRDKDNALLFLAMTLVFMPISLWAIWQLIRGK